MHNPKSRRYRTRWGWKQELVHQMMVANEHLTTIAVTLETVATLTGSVAELVTDLHTEASDNANELQDIRNAVDRIADMTEKLAESEAEAREYAKRLMKIQWGDPFAAIEVSDRDLTPEEHDRREME